MKTVGVDAILDSKSENCTKIIGKSYLFLSFKRAKSTKNDSSLCEQEPKRILVQTMRKHQPEI